MDAVTAKKYGLNFIPKNEVVRPKNVQSLNDDNVDIIEIAKRVMKEHKEVLDALAKR